MAEGIEEAGYRGLLRRSPLDLLSPACPARLYITQVPIQPSRSKSGCLTGLVPGLRGEGQVPRVFEPGPTHYETALTHGFAPKSG